MAERDDVRRRVPRTDALLPDPRMQQAVQRLGADLVKQIMHGVQRQVRTGEVRPEAAVDRCLPELPDAATTLYRVLNATGVVLHTNLGRAPLSGAPDRTLPGWAVALAEEYAAALRLGRRRVAARIVQGQCLLDLRRIPPQDDVVLAAAVAVAVARDWLATAPEAPCT